MDKLTDSYEITNRFRWRGESWLVRCYAANRFGVYRSTVTVGADGLGVRGLYRPDGSQSWYVAYSDGAPVDIGSEYSDFCLAFARALDPGRSPHP